MSAPVVVRYTDVAAAIMAALEPCAATCRWRESKASHYIDIAMTKTPPGALPFKVTVADAAINLDAGPLSLKELSNAQREYGLAIIEGIIAGRVREVALYRPGASEPLFQRVSVLDADGRILVRHARKKTFAALTARKGLVARRTRYAPYF